MEKHNVTLGRINLLTPDDFKNDPYTAGLNQMGHIVVWAAFAVVFGWYAGFIVVAWEGYQYRRLGALRSDFWADFIFGLIGVFCYQWEYFLPMTAAMGGAWMLYMDYVNGRD